MYFSLENFSFVTVSLRVEDWCGLPSCSCQALQTLQYFTFQLGQFRVALHHQETLVELSRVDTLCKLRRIAHVHRVFCWVFHEGKHLFNAGEERFETIGVATGEFASCLNQRFYRLQVFIRESYLIENV